MPDEPHNYHCNNAASEELRRQSTRAKQILERLAAHLAATEPGRDPDFDDLVEAHHVRQAAELLLGSVTAPDALGVSQHWVFRSIACS